MERMHSNKSKFTGFLRITAVATFCTLLGVVIAIAMMRNYFNKPTYQASNNNPSSVDTEKKVTEVTKQPVSSSTTNTQTVQTSPKVSGVSTTISAQAAEYQRQADELRKQVAESTRCRNIERPAYTTYIAKRDGFIADYSTRTKNIFLDKRLSLYQAEAVERYNIEKMNSGSLQAYDVYKNTVTSQKCSILDTIGPALRTVPANYPDLMLNYPYLADYPYISL